MLYFFVHYIPAITLFSFLHLFIMIYTHQLKCLVYVREQSKRMWCRRTEELSATASVPSPLAQWHSYVVHYFFSDLVLVVARHSHSRRQMDLVREKDGWEKTCCRSKKNEKSWKCCRKEGRKVIMDVVGIAEADRKWGGGAVQRGRGSSTW